MLTYTHLSCAQARVVSGTEMGHSPLRRVAQVISECASPDPPPTHTLSLSAVQDAQRRRAWVRQRPSRLRDNSAIRLGEVERSVKQAAYSVMLEFPAKRRSMRGHPGDWRESISGGMVRSVVGTSDARVDPLFRHGTDGCVRHHPRSRAELCAVQCVRLVLHHASRHYGRLAQGLEASLLGARQ